MPEPRINMSNDARQRIETLLQKLLHHASEPLAQPTPASQQINQRWCPDDLPYPRLIIEAKLTHLAELTYEDQLSSDAIEQEMNRLGGRIRQDLKTLEGLGLIEDYRAKTKGSLKQHFTFRLWDPNPAQNLPLFRETWSQLKQAKKEGRLQAVIANRIVPPSSQAPSNSPLQDWGDAPDVPIFYGRDNELKTLKQWILKDQCRLVTILGMRGIGKTHLSLKLRQGGIGKTDLSLKLAKGIQTQFHSVIWRSLINAPSLSILLQDLIQCLSRQRQTTIPESPEAQISRLLHYLREQRCLLILDNAESILQPGGSAGAYRSGYEAYGQLLQQVGAGNHKSCLILTSREKPHNLCAMAGQNAPVRLIELGGLSPSDGQALFQNISQFSGSDQDWQTLTRFYGGNPLALELAAHHIERAFSGQISAFLKSGRPLFSDLRDLLDWHFDRLSEREQELLYWLAINREPVTVQNLKFDLLLPSSQRATAETLQSLQSRLPLERSKAGFTLQPVLIEYMSDRLIQAVCQSIQTESLDFCNRYPLYKASAPDYLRKAQQRLILIPVLEQLREIFQGTTALQIHLNQLLNQLRIQDPLLKGYAPGTCINLLRMMQVDLDSYDFSGLCLRQADFRGLNLRKTSFQNAHIHQCNFSQPIHIPMMVKFSRDGELIAVGEAGGLINVYAAESLQHLLTLQGHRSWSVGIDFHPIQSRIATGSMDGTIKLWDLETGQCLKTLSDPQQLSLWSVSFTTNGQHVVGAGVDGNLRLWNAETGELTRVLTGHTNVLYSVATHPIESIAASGSEDHTIKIWNLETGECKATLAEHSNSVRGVAFSPDGTLLASASLDSQVKLWRVDNLACVATLTDHAAPVNSVAFSPDGKQLISGSEDETIRIWDLSQLKCMKVLPCKDLVMRVAYSPKGDLVAGASYDNTVPFWNTATWKRVFNMVGHSDFAMSLACLPPESDFREVADNAQPFPLAFFSAGKYSPLRKWHIGSNREEKYSESSLENALTIAFSSKTNILATAGFGSQIQLWDADKLEPIDSLTDHVSSTYSLDFSPDGTLLASTSLDHTIKLWNLKRHACIHSFTGHSTGVWGVVFSSDQKTLVSCSLDTTIKVWSLETYQCLKTLEGHKAGVRDISLSSDGQTLFSGSLDGTVKIWDLPSGKCRQTLTGHTNLIWAIDLSPNDQFIASCSHDCTIRIWNATTGQCLHVLDAHTHSIWTVSFTPDSCLLLSGSDDQTLRIWNVATGECIKVLTSPRPYEGMNISGMQGITEAQKLSLQILGAL